MSDEKLVAIATKVTPEVATAFDDLWERLGFKSRIHRVKELVEADIAAGGLLEKRLTAPEQPAAEVSAAQPAAVHLTPDVRDQLRKELSVIAYLLLSAHGRTGSSAVARKLVTDLYLSGQLHKELDDP